MIFVGDIAHPFPHPPEWENVQAVFKGETVIGNLEGAISAEPGLLKKHLVFNHPSIFDTFRQFQFKVLSLANNHVTDIPSGIEKTKERLREKGISSVGAGSNLADASLPCVLEENGVQIVFLAFGWNVISCKTAKKDQPGINPLTRENVFRSIASAQRKYPAARIVLLMHWNYELEIYPQPFHRQLAFESIDHGVHAVIGCHSHCLQGIEYYKGRPIVYGLGNWHFPHGIYFNGKLKFPEFSRTQLAFEWSGSENEGVCHLFQYDPQNHSLAHLKTTPWDQCAETGEMTPFRGMAHEEYIPWFRANRRKKKLLPIYKYGTPLENFLNDNWVILRHKMIQGMMKIGIKGAPR